MDNTVTQLIGFLNRAQSGEEVGYTAEQIAQGIKEHILGKLTIESGRMIADLLYPSIDEEDDEDADDADLADSIDASVIEGNSEEILAALVMTLAKRLDLPLTSASAHAVWLNA